MNRDSLHFANFLWCQFGFNSPKSFLLLCQKDRIFLIRIPNSGDFNDECYFLDKYSHIHAFEVLPLLDN